MWLLFKSQTVPYWENPSVVEINKENYHSTLILPSKKEECKEIYSLNGIWKFHWSPDPESRPVDFYINNFDNENWNTIAVPGTWQLQGYGKPIYTNINPPYLKNQPKVTSEPPKDYYSYKNRNPVGSYITSFHNSPVTSGEICLNIFAHLKVNKLWANKGFVVAKEQFLIKTADALQWKVSRESASFKTTPDGVVITGGLGTFKISSSIGALTSWMINGNELLKGNLEPHFWKPPNDNQKRNKYSTRLGVWRNAGKTRVVDNLKVNIIKGIVIVEITMTLPAVDAKYNLKYQVNGIGQLKVEASYLPKKTDVPLMPKFGMKMQIPRDISHIRWYGHGEFENYPDRVTAAFLGIYQSDIQNFITHYIAPQDNANRCGTRWFSLGNSVGKIIITGLQPLCFRAWPYTEEDLEKANHPHELPDRDFIMLNLDLNIFMVLEETIPGGHVQWKNIPLMGTNPIHMALLWNIRINNRNYWSLAKP